MNRDFEIEKLETKSGDTTVKVNGFFLHSKYDPKKEVIQFVEKHYKPNSLHILYGYGLGYYSEALLNTLKNNEELIVIDPIYHLINLNVEPKLNIVKDIYDEKFKILISSKIEKFNRRVNVILSPNYDNILSSEYKDFLEIISEQAKLNRINENTIRFFAEDWQKNYILNLYNAVGDKSLSELKKKYNVPVVIASGGPSLTKQLPLLNQIKERVLIIAAGSTINTLLSHDINPDYVVSVDGSLANYNHFKELNLEHTTYIYSLLSHHQIRDSFQNTAYIFNSLGKNKLKNHFEKLTDFDLPVIAGGGSVANFAFTIANYIATGPIAIIGQDLAYTDNKTHAENNKNYKALDEGYKKARGMFLSEGYYGDKVLTDHVFLSMKESFEKLLELVEKDREIYNCTEGGINLKGYNKLSFKDFCSKYVNKINKIPDLNKFSDELHRKRSILRGQMIEELKFYEKTREILVDNLFILNSNKSNVSFSKNTLKKLDANDVKLKDYLENIAMISIVDPITINIKNNYLPSLNETAEDTYKRVFNQNKELYSKLLEALDLSQGYTKELISKIKTENEGQ